MLINDRRDPTRQVTYIAQEAFLIQGQSGPQVLMFDGMAQTLNPETNILGVTYYEELSIALDDMTSGQTLRLLDHRELPTHILLNPPEEVLFWTQRNAIWLASEAHTRFAQALLVIPAGILGMACLLSGRFTRFGLWRQILLACILILILKVLENATIDMAKDDATLWPVIYGPTVLCAILAFGFLRYADRRMTPTAGGGVAAPEQVGATP